MPKNISEKIPDCFISIIEHSNFKQCLHQLRELVHMQTSTRIVLVTGPTGAGKTTAREQFARELECLAAPEIAGNPEMVAYGACSVKAPGPTAFSWKDTYLQMLLSLHHPFVDAKLGRTPKEVQSDAGANVRKMTPDTAHRQSNDRLFRVLQRTISHRQPKALIFDEAHHLLRVSSSQTLVNQLEHIKYMADETRTLHVLFGTYELIQLMDLSSALIRRREIVHFPRYIYESGDPEKSLKAFADVVAVFARDLDEMSAESLLLQVPYLYQGSVGCVGVLRDWLFRAYSRARSTKSAIITKAILEKAIFSPGDRLALIKDAKSGEKYFRERALHETNYLIELGFIPPEEESDEELETPSGKRPKTNPFQRKPHNDPVGTAHLDAAYKKPEETS